MLSCNSEVLETACGVPGRSQTYTPSSLLLIRRGWVVSTASKTGLCHVANADADTSLAVFNGLRGLMHARCCSSDCYGLQCVIPSTIYSESSNFDQIKGNAVLTIGAGLGLALLAYQKATRVRWGARRNQPSTIVNN